MQCFVDWMLKAGLISSWDKKQNSKSYLPVNKHSGFNLNHSSHTDLPCENFALLDGVWAWEKRVLEY